MDFGILNAHCLFFLLGTKCFGTGLLIRNSIAAFSFFNKNGSLDKSGSGRSAFGVGSSRIWFCSFFITTNFSERILLFVKQYECVVMNRLFERLPFFVTAATNNKTAINFIPIFRNAHSIKSIAGCRTTRRENYCTWPLF